MLVLKTGIHIHYFSCNFYITNCEINNYWIKFRFKNNYLDTLNNREFLSFVAKYKFTIAFENAICNDYITEKLWRPLIVGSVPIYYGSPSFKVFYIKSVS